MVEAPEVETKYFGEEEVAVRERPRRMAEGEECWLEEAMLRIMEELEHSCSRRTMLGSVVG